MKTNKLKQQKGTLLRVLQYVKPYRVLVIISLLCACVSAAAQLLIPILTGKAIDQMLGAGQVNLSGVLVFAVWIAVVAALSAAAQQFLATSNNKIAYNISRDLRNAAFHKLQRLPLSYLDAHPSGDLVSRMIADVDTFSDGLLMGFTQLFTGVVLIELDDCPAGRGADAAVDVRRVLHRPKDAPLLHRAGACARAADGAHQRTD